MQLTRISAGTFSHKTAETILDRLSTPKNVSLFNSIVRAERKLKAGLHVNLVQSIRPMQANTIKVNPFAHVTFRFLPRSGVHSTCSRPT